MKKSLFLTLLLSIFSCSHNETIKSPKDQKTELYFGQGTYELNQKNYTEALKFLTKANELTPNDSKILNNLAMAYYLKNYPNRAIKLLEKSLQLDDKNWDARNNLASIYFKLGKIELAKQEYKKIEQVVTYENQHRVLFNLGLIAIKENNIEEGIKYFKKSLEENPEYCPAHFQLGLIHYKLKEFQSALKRFHSASLGVCYKSPAPTYYQGLSLLQIHEYTRAKEKFQDILHRFPDNELAKKSRNKLELLEDKIEMKQSATRFIPENFKENK